ncbi:MAG: squalene synthase HpnC [Pseudomonadota bacterium]
MHSKLLTASYQYCQNLAKKHYENFPVASWFLPKKLRQPITVIYAFARTADDFADEGNLSSQQRLKLIANYHQELSLLKQHKLNSDNPIFIALYDVIQKFQLPIELFHHLLEAFEQDVNTRQYQDFTQLLNYCHKSASPIGRLLLHLHNENSPDNLQLSDKICSALQLINFLQDMQQDALESKRLYIPLNDIELFQLDDNILLKRIKSGEIFNKNERLLFKYQIQQAEKLLLDGKLLINQLSGRFRFEIALIVSSGLKVLQQLKKSNKFSDRPRLTSWDKVTILTTSIRFYWID